MQAVRRLKATVDRYLPTWKHKIVAYFLFNTTCDLVLYKAAKRQYPEYMHHFWNPIMLVSYPLVLNYVVSFMAVKIL